MIGLQREGVVEPALYALGVALQLDRLLSRATSSARSTRMPRSPSRTGQGAAPSRRSVVVCQGPGSPAGRELQYGRRVGWGRLRPHQDAVSSTFAGAFRSLMILTRVRRDRSPATRPAAQERKPVSRHSARPVPPPLDGAGVAAPRPDSAQPTANGSLPRRVVGQLGRTLPALRPLSQRRLAGALFAPSKPAREPVRRLCRRSLRPDARCCAPVRLAGCPRKPSAPGSGRRRLRAVAGPNTPVDDGTEARTHSRQTPGGPRSPAAAHRA